MDAALDSPFGAIARNWSLASQGPGFASDTYITNSDLACPGEGFVVGHTFEWEISLSKTAAGTATPILVFRLGTAKTTADTALLTLTGQAATAAVSGGFLRARLFVRTNGATGVVVGSFGFISGIPGLGGGIDGVSGSVDLTSANAKFLGLSLNAGASAAWTITSVRAASIG